MGTFRYSYNFSLENESVHHRCAHPKSGSGPICREVAGRSTMRMPPVCNESLGRIGARTLRGFVAAHGTVRENGAGVAGRRGRRLNLRHSSGQDLDAGIRHCYAIFVSLRRQAHGLRRAEPLRGQVRKLNAEH